MNLLIDTLPSKVDDCEIRTDFRVWLRVNALVEGVVSERLIERDYFVKTMDDLGDLIFLDWPDFYTIDVFRGVLDFLSCKDARQFNLDKSGKTASNPADIAFDMAFDSGAIYASFLQQYQMDLRKVKQLHWFEFNVLLQNLTDETPLQNRIKLRRLKASDVPKEKLNDLKRIQNLYRIPISEVDQACKSALTEYLKGGK